VLPISGEPPSASDSSEVKTVETIGDLLFFTCDPDEEQEADWLAGCLLLPRPLLLRAASRGADVAQIAVDYGVGEQMAAFRLRTTGVTRQLAARRERQR
jgi:Zn-dependent peptidase ImmA (M78 family)